MITSLVVSSMFAITAQHSVGSKMQDRAKDWRNGAVVYQVFVDRFVPPTDQAAAKSHFESPRVFKSWDELPKAGKFSETSGVWSHELEFWGGNLNGVSSKLDYISNLGADVLYLNPIHEAYTNHKYDAIDYKKVDPAYGSMKDLERLIQQSHKKSLKVVLDGVFNHMGRRSPVFQDALKNPKSLYRDWFFIDSKYKNGYKGWIGGTNMPVNQVESPGMAKYLWGSSDSVVQSYLKRGIDGWRLDVAYELGKDILADITKSAHKAKKDSLVVGEMLGYPAGWYPHVDGQYNLFATSVCKEMLSGELTGGHVGALLNDWIEDAGIDHALKSWLVADNHDMDRLASVFESEKDRFLMLAMLLTLPGSPNIYYGTELGMVGKGDPANRAPMKWDLVNESNKTLAWTKLLLSVRKRLPALKYGDFTSLRSNKLLAFTRTTGKLRENVIVLVNPTDRTVKETFSHRIGNLMSWQSMEDVLTNKRVLQKSGLIAVEVPAKSIQIFVPVIDRTNGFSPYDRIK